MRAFLLVLLLPGIAAAQQGASPGTDDTDAPALFPEIAARLSRLEEQGWLVHGQATFVLQGHPRFRSPYQGPGSLKPEASAANTLSTDLILGRRLWQGAEAVVDLSVTRGFGLSNSTGVAAFPNNEAFRLGSTEPTFFVPRAFFRQTIGLSADMVEGEDDPLRFSGPIPRERLTITIGKMSVWDIFDRNSYAHDARTQFLNWALVGAGAVDYAADARGWTIGAAAEWENGTWGLRAGAFQVARRVNGLFLDPSITRAWQLLGEVDRFTNIGGRPGAIRLILGLSRTRQSSWDEIDPRDPESFELNPHGYRTKRMAALTFEQELAEDLGAFARLSWNDGRTQNWMFTEMDRAVSAGLSLKGGRWNRPGDTVGLGGNIGWISEGRRRYLEAGGIGFITGDGALRGGPEYVAEAFYDAALAPGLNLAFDVQHVVNPAYNRDRGPVTLFALRARVSF
jgi:high affinity Mn2+ porin